MGGHNAFSVFQADTKQQDMTMPTRSKRTSEQVLATYKNIEKNTDQWRDLVSRASMADLFCTETPEESQKAVSKRILSISKELQQLSVRDGSSFLLIQTTPSQSLLGADKFSHCI